MENFGLGLVLNFQDNATSKIDSVIGMMESLQKSINEVANSASGSIQSISGMSNALLTLGAGVTAFGGAGVAAIGSFVKSVQTMGSEFEQNITALTQLYGDANVAQQKFLAFEQMSAATPLGMQAIQSAATRLKTVGIEAEKTFNVMVDGEKKTRPILEIFGDLAAIRPDKGLDTVIREAIEFIEGNARPLKLSFGLDPKSKDSIGEQLADTAEGRADQLVRIIEKAGYTGMLDKTNDQWNTIMQNLGDNFNLLMYYVSIGSGLFEEIKKPFKDLFELLRGIVGEQDDMKVIGGAIADGLRVVIAPVMALLFGFNKLVALLAQFTKEHPKIVSMGIAFVGIASQITLVAGVGLVALGVFLKLRVMVIKLIADFRTFIATTRLAGMSFGMLLRSILPVTIALGFLYYAWTTNFLGLRTIVGGTLQYLANLFEIVSDAMTHIDVDKGVFSLTKKHHNLAEQMGIMPLLKALATGYHYAVMFGRGLSQGIADAQEFIGRLNTQIDNLIKKLTDSPVAKNLENAGKAIKTYFNSKTANDIEYIGKVLGQISVFALLAFSPFKRLPVIVNNLGRLRPILEGLGRSIQSFARSPRFFTQSILRSIAGLPSKAGALFTRLGHVMVRAFNSAGRRAAQSFLRGFSFVSRGIGAVMRGITTVLRTLSSFDRIVTVFRTLGTTLLRIATNGAFRALFKLGGLVTKISPVGIALMALGLIISFIINHWEEFQTVALTVWNHVQETISGVVKRLQPVFDRLKEAFDKLVEKFPFLGEIVNTVVEFVTTAFGMLVGTVSMDSEQASAVLNTLGAVFEFVFDLVATVVEVAIGVVASVLTGLFEVLDGVIDFIEGVFTGNWTQAWEGIKKIFSGIWDAIKGIAENTINAISGFLDRIIGKADDAKKAAQDAGDVGSVAEFNRINKSALGGIYSRPLLTWVAEAGYPEAIVPLDGSARGVALWEQAGRMLGALPDSLTSAEKVTAPIPTPAPVRTVPIPVPVSAPQPAQAPSDGGITFEAGSIQFNVTTDNFDADKAAQMIMPILQRKVEIMRMTSRQGGALV